jgi:hypothetical protein
VGFKSSRLHQGAWVLWQGYQVFTLHEERFESATPYYMLREADIEDLKRICSLNVEPPAFYKGGFYFNDSGRRASNILSRHGVIARLNDDTGKVAYAIEAPSISE